MRTKLNGLLTLLLAFVVHISYAQDKTITGTVTDADGLPLPGVNIVVEGTTTGTQTDFDGNYAISASEGQTLLFTYIGQRPSTKVVGASSVINVQMVEDTQALEEVIVTAQGIKREKKALGYAVSSVGEEDLEQRADGDVARVLSGKASGVNITAAGGMSGSGTNVVIRGLSSFSGSNQALFVVDGVPFSSDTNAQGNFLDGNTGSSRFLDLDPNNIASVEVLKGLAAATLYGTQGKNGVILITTKAGSGEGGAKKTEITVNQSYFVNAMASLPDYQDEYGGGFDQSFGWFYSNWGPKFERGGVAGWGNQPAIDDNGTLPHPYSTTAIQATRDAFPELQNARYDWRPYDSVENFFRPGGVSNTSVNINGGTQDGSTSFNVNLGYLNDESFVPGNELQRFNISVGGRTQLTNKFTISAAMNYSRTDYRTPPVAASRGNGSLGFSTFGAVFFTPRNVDLMGLPFENPIDNSSVYYRNGNDIMNPRWIVKNAQNSQLTNRFFWNASANYALSDNLDLTYRAGMDFYTERNTQYSNKGGVTFNNAIFGFLNTYDNNNTIWDHYLALNGNYDLSEKLGMTFTAGATTRSTTFDQQGVQSTGQLVYGVVRHFNYSNQLPIQYTERRNIAGVLGQVTLDYDNMLFLTGSTRTDWVSNLITENNSRTYPSGSISFLPTAAFPELQSQGGLNFLKLRAGIGSSATFPTAYPTVGIVEQNTQVYGEGGGITTNQVASFKANPDLKPELLSEFELGFESRFFNSRVSLDFTYFDRTTKDLIVREPLSPSTGFTFTQSNVGKIEGDGIEIDASVDWFRSDSPDGFNWNTRANFSTYNPVVTEQEQDIIIYAGSSTLFVGGNAAIKGKPLGAMVGTAVGRDADGNFLVNDAGDYVIVEQDLDGNVPVIGDPNPDYIMNIINSMSFKNWNFGFQLSHTKGGDIMSNTIATLLGRGLITETLNRENTYILPGVLQSTGEVNNKQTNNASYYFDNVLFGPAELKVYDASVIRLQEVSLGYSFPKKFLDKTPFGTLTITAQGFNLWYDAYNTPDGANFDPNVQGAGIGNAQGFDFINGPSARKYGLSVKASF
ncbi:SusC/RagA family TonB-linked outer membrane protein [Flagellimonas halotolerans]|uniref:SusC/RagA family TonB-linked outer membrane protein n=1 Tax=Flagellimonas halotolerans TaxID=3112164 RepID=A0ABU6ISR2_9FLAO|nr:MULTISPECIES: SusC/RagA family TonB-linked outer membrane protein [unclassified Allomuricauda]MEC3966297.1 SusC/RagA family TonB-linked outer membrane protein [Muricauda sp. SYSU M86414]MEC4266162.1 SusC/RagA family TonB-linked outer membrane protein [Muricauda sp. SYSU M84420]